MFDPSFSTLALDCSLKNVTLAVIQNQNVLASYNGIPNEPQSTSLINIIDDILKQANLVINDIHHVLFCNGPGSFTSLRVGLATLKGLFWDHNAQFYQTSSLLLRCYSKEQSNDDVQATIQLGRQKYVVGRLINGDQFEEKLCLNQQTIEFDSKDVINIEAFLKIIKYKHFKRVEKDDLHIEYFLEPDFG